MGKRKPKKRSYSTKYVRSLRRSADSWYRKNLCSESRVDELTEQLSAQDYFVLELCRLDKDLALKICERTGYRTPYLHG